MKPQERVAQRFQREAMARGTLVVDENVQALAAALKDANIRVIIPPSGMPDEQIKPALLSNRIIVTRNSKDFVHDASVYDCGIVSLDKLSFIDASPNYETNKTAQLISRAIKDYDLWSKRSGFILVLHDNGRHVLRPLTV
jgi:hypothetical protein